ncbi:MAG: DUF6783 domain-containing protein [Blautia faecis]
MKNHSAICAPLCGIFRPNSVAVAATAPHPDKISHKCNAHLAESIFQTRSSNCFSSLFL